MPLERLQVRNEYGLGRPELYKETNREDPKAVLDGVAVAGLVGILRQLGDLADFAAEVFHGLQEQLLNTASRSHKLMLRAKGIEASLLPLEKAILAQNSHIHFAYTARCEWHYRTTTAQNHFIYNDLPQFILDSYEECRDPPHLHLLDKFDAGGPGSCLRRYSDPTFFKRVSSYSDEAYTEKIEKARKTSRSKKKRSSKRIGEILQGEQMPSNSGRMQFTSRVDEQTSSSQTASAIDTTLKSDPEDHSNSFDSSIDAGYIECVFYSSNSVQPDEQEHKESSSPRLPQKTFTLQLASPAVGDNFSHDSFDKHIASTSTGLSWDKQEEIVDFKSLPCDRDETPEILAEKQDPHIHEDEAVTSANIDCSDFLYGQESNMKPVFCWLQTNKIQHESDNCLGALNSIESESGNDLDCETKREVEQSTSHVTCEIMENGVDGAASTVLDHGLSDGISQTIFCVSKNNETGWDFPDSPREVVPVISEPYVISLESSFPSDVPVNIERTKILADSHDSGSPIQEQVMHIRGNSVLDFLAGTNFLDNAHPFNDTVSASIETALTDVPVDVERTNHIADSLASESPSHKETPTKCEISVLDCCVGTNPWGIHTHGGTMSESDVTGPSYIPVNIGRADHLTDSCASESPICEEVSQNIGNSATDCSVSTNLFGDAQTLDDTVSAFIETVSSDVPVHMGRTKNLADSDGSENLIYEKLPHMCGNSDLDYSIGTSALGDPHTLSDAVSASTETGPSEVSVDIGRANVFIDSHASESPICEQVPLKCGVPVSDCSVGTDTLGDVQTLSESVSAVSIDTLSSDVPLDIGRTKNLVESDASEIRICEQVPQTCGNSVLDYSIGTNSSGDAHTLNSAVSASIESVSPDVPTNLEVTKNLANSPVSESSIHEQMPHICGNSVLNCSIGTNSLGNAHTLVSSASIESGSKSSDLPNKEADGINSNTYECEETHPESATDPSVGLWTNGGLLGLEPSKPPDFILPSSLNHESLTSINETDGALNQNSILKSNGHKEKQDLPAEIAELNKNEPSPRCLISQYDDQACIPGKTFDCHQLSSGFGQNDKEDLDEVRVLAPGSVVPASQNTKTACTEHNKGSGENSPLLFGLTHKLLMNSFRRRVSFDEKSGPDNSLKTGLLEQSGQNSTVHQSLPETTFKEKVSRESPIYSPPPSPQLEHMKISFHPVNELETFKLKLKFPEGSKHRESMRDMFPSFHLVPEPSTPLHDSGSNLDDDDTFGRSSPFVSDDCLSPQSDYNSDRWESDDTPNSSDHEVYDSSLGISFTQSNLSSQEIRGGTHVDIDNGLSMYSKDTVESSLHGPLLDFPSFDTVKPVLVKECNKHSDYSNTLKLQSHSQPTQPEPPHPPNQKWVSNLQLDMMNECKTYISEDAEKIYDPNISEPTVQPRLAQLEQNKTDQEDHEFYDDSSCKLKDKLNQRGINGQKRDDQVGIGKDMNEKQDFLHQIRTKSFNLKRTVTGKPNATTSPTINVKVTAILEKTNAIRQVVASDDGEDDDSWSDT